MWGNWGTEQLTNMPKVTQQGKWVFEPRQLGFSVHALNQSHNLPLLIRWVILSMNLLVSSLTSGGYGQGGPWKASEEKRLRESDEIPSLRWSVRPDKAGDQIFSTKDFYLTNSSRSPMEEIFHWVLLPALCCWQSGGLPSSLSGLFATTDLAHTQYSLTLGGWWVVGGEGMIYQISMEIKILPFSFGWSPYSTETKLDPGSGRYFGNWCLIMEYY